MTLATPSTWVRLLNAGAVIVPFLGLVAAAVLLWERGFSWLHLGLFLGGYVVTTLGITVGYHRLFTHRSFRTGRAIRALLGILGSMSMQGPVLRWVATHRLHHQHSDDPHDPHSPHLHHDGSLALLSGMYHAHIGWFFTPAPTNMERYVRDLRSDATICWVDRLFVVWVTLGLLIPSGIALAVTGTWMGAALGFVWGGLVRIFFVHHITWSVNSVCHLWGTVPYRSRDESRNNALFGVLAFGEGWHNAHHAFPTSARHGLRWWELDLTYFVIRSMAVVGLAKDVRVPTAERIAAKRNHACAADKR